MFPCLPFPMMPFPFVAPPFFSQSPYMMGPNVMNGLSQLLLAANKSRSRAYSRSGIFPSRKRGRPSSSRSRYDDSDSDLDSDFSNRDDDDDDDFLNRDDDDEEDDVYGRTNRSRSFYRTYSPSRQALSDKRWLKKYSKATRFLKRYGHLNVTLENTNNDVRFVAWWAAQKKLFIRQRLPYERRNLIDQLGYLPSEADREEVNNMSSDDESDDDDDNTNSFFFDDSEDDADSQRHRDGQSADDDDSDDHDDLHGHDNVGGSGGGDLSNDEADNNNNNSRAKRPRTAGRSRARAEKAWQRRFSDLKAYLKRSDDVDLVTLAPRSKLGTWVQQQRDDALQGVLSEEHRQQLETINFDFGSDTARRRTRIPRKTTNFAASAATREQEGKRPIPSGLESIYYSLKPVRHAIACTWRSGRTCISESRRSTTSTGTPIASRPTAVIMS